MEFPIQQTPIRTRHLTNSPVPSFAKGLWTPGLVLGGVDTLDAVYSRQDGIYTLIGNLFIGAFELGVSTLPSGTGNAFLKGLLFSPHPELTSAVGFGGLITFWSGMASALINMNLSDIVTTSTGISTRIGGLTAGNVSWQQLTNTDFSNGCLIAGMVIYNIDDR